MNSKELEIYYDGNGSTPLYKYEIMEEDVKIVHVTDKLLFVLSFDDLTGYKLTIASKRFSQPEAKQSKLCCCVTRHSPHRLGIQPHSSRVFDSIHRYSARILPILLHSSQ